MKRATIRDVARDAGFSITTVSMALNNYPGISEETKRRIEEVAEELNYVPNAAGRSLGGITEKTIGLLINNLMPEEPSGAVYGFLSGTCHACRDKGIGFLLITTDNREQEKINLKRLCLSKGLSGIICSGFRMSDPYIQQIREGEIDIPCVCIDLETGNEAVPNISIDNRLAADEAVSFLISSGRREIAIVNSSDNVDVSIKRTRGYLDALEREGLASSPKRRLNADFSEERAYQMTADLLAEDRSVDAIFCISDVMALGACRAVEDAGLTVGKEIAVVGFDDIPAARYLYGGLTTVRQDFYRMGYTAGCCAYEKIQGQEDSDVTHLLYQLVVRGSAPA